MRVRPRLLALLVGAPLSLGAQGGVAEGVRLYDAGQVSAARTVFAASYAADAKNAQAAFWLGRLALEEDDADRAAENLERATKLDPNSSTYFMWLGRAYGTQAQRANVFRQAALARRTKGAWERAVQLDPNNLDARSDLVDFYLLAPGIMGGSVEKALGEADEIGHRNQLRGLLERGRVFEHDNKPADAEREFLAATRETSERPIAYNRVILFYQGTKQWDKGFAVTDSMFAHYPNEHTNWFVLGRLGAASGQHLDRAQEAVEKYLQTPAAKDEPPFAAAHWRLGMIHEKRNDRAGARAEYETAVRLDPKFKPASDALERVR